MILIDGIRYNLHKLSSEDELEQMVREHSEEIWGQNSVYFDKKKLQSRAGIVSIPDGYVIIFESSPQWYVVEVELSSHPLYDHIVAQISKFASGVANMSSQKEIVKEMDTAINGDEILKAWVKTKLGSSEIHKFLTEIIGKPPVLAIIINEKTEQLDEVCNQLPTKFLHSVKVVEFKTFQREGCESKVHAHLFEPLHAPPHYDMPPQTREKEELRGRARGERAPVKVDGRPYESAAAACHALGIDVGGDSGVRVLKRALKNGRLTSLEFMGASS